MGLGVACLKIALLIVPIMVYCQLTEAEVASLFAALAIGLFGRINRFSTRLNRREACDESCFFGVMTKKMIE